ncbi:MAG: hypothetical protein PHX51_04660 [Clostridia bacterium]|nr:hypothetical protein [Clostridia bacterium]
MKKTICKKEYDTETATLLRKNTFGEYGDPQGYEESVYQTPDGLYFLYCYGGRQSKYKEEIIKRIAKKDIAKHV